MMEHEGRSMMKTMGTVLLWLVTVAVGLGITLAGPIRRRCPDDDQPAAPFGNLFVVGDDTLVHRPIGIGRADIGRHMADAVGDLEVADANRAEQMG